MLSDFYPPVVGGMERHVESLSRKLIDRGHDVRVCTSWHEGLPKFEVIQGVKVTRIEGFFQKVRYLYGDPTRRYPPPTYDALTTRKLESLIREHKPELIHAHGWILYSALQLRHKMKVPIVVTLHDYGLICPKKTLLLSNRNVCETPFTPKCVRCAGEEYGLPKSLLVSVLTKHNRKYLDRVDRYLAVSSFVREVHCKYLGLPAADVVVIPNFHDADQEIDEAGLSGTLPDDFILFVGSLHPAKGVDTLTEAYSLISTKTSLVLIGAKRPRYTYREKSNVRVFENAPVALVAEAYKRCRFVIIPFSQIRVLQLHSKQ